jgi:hypothetical protein
MELTDEIEEKEEMLSEEKQDDIFYALLNGKTYKETISSSRGDFIVKFPKQKDIIHIGWLEARMRSGIPAGFFDVATEYEIHKCAALDTMVESGPAWYGKAKQKNENFSWRDMPDAAFVDEVFASADSFRKKVQAKLAKPKEETPGKAAEPGGVQEAVGDNVFSGVAGTVKRDRG